MSTQTFRAGALGLGFALSFMLPAILMTPPAAAEVLATVNGTAITDADLKIAAEDLGSSIPQQLQGKARDTYLLDYLIDSELVAQKAGGDKLDQDPDFTKRLAYYRGKILTEMLLKKVAKDAVTPEKLQQTYDLAAKADKPQTEIHARHILVDTEAAAEAALKRIKAGEDFAKVAKEVSKDGGADGGDLGWFTKDRMIPEFADAAFKLNEGEVSDPVKTPVRLAHHQSRRQKANHLPALRSGEGASGSLRSPTGAVPTHSAIAQGREDRARRRTCAGRASDSADASADAGCGASARANDAGPRCGEHAAR